MYWIYKRIKEIIEKYFDYESHYLLWDDLGPI